MTEPGPRPARPIDMDIRQIRMWLAAAATVTVLAVLGACAESPGDPGGTPSPTPPTATPPATTPPAAPVTPSPPMPTVSPPVGERTITGEIHAGVEATCLVLRTGGDDYLLVGDYGDLRPGMTATVRGYPDPDLMTFCQQGTPFVVTEVVSP